MSERDFWDEESFQQYKADLIRQRNELNPVTNQFHIKILDDMIKNLPEKYPEQVYIDDCNDEKKSNCKKFWDTIGFWVLISPFVIIPVASLIIILCHSSDVFDYIVEFLTKIGGVHWLVGLIIIPLAIVALVQVLRGAFLLLEVDADILRLNEKRKDWKGSLYCVINFLGYVALYILLKRI